MKKINRRIFKPFIFICLGLMAVMLMSAARPCDPPGKPGRPEIAEWGEGSCTIRFTPPRSDGGAPITDYIVEKRYRGGGEWEKAVKQLDYEIKVDNLIAGREVEFRVSAVNKAGQGEPSDPSKPFIVRGE